MEKTSQTSRNNSVVLTCYDLPQDKRKKNIIQLSLLATVHQKSTKLLSYKCNIMLRYSQGFNGFFSYTEKVRHSHSCSTKCPRHHLRVLYSDSIVPDNQTYGETPSLKSDYFHVKITIIIYFFFLEPIFPSYFFTIYKQRNCTFNENIFKNTFLER